LRLGSSALRARIQSQGSPARMRRRTARSQRS
jgi:hypothetical protein